VIARLTLARWFLVSSALGVMATALPFAARAATLVHSNDVLGDIEPCGCRNNPMGGVARKSNFLAKAKLEDPSILQLDAGDLLFSTHEIPELLKDQSELQARYLLKAMDELGLDAWVPGEKDLALGLKAFEKLVKGGKSRVLAANLVARKGGRAPFAKSAIFERKGLESEGGKPLKIAVVGIVGEGLPYPSELKVLPALAAAKSAVAAVRKKADLVVLLTHAGLEADRELAAKVPGVDILIGGHSQSFLQEPQKVGKTTIYQSSFRNQYLGVLPLRAPFTGAGYKLVGLDAGYESPADKPGAMDTHVAEFKKALAELNTKSDAQMQKLTSITAAKGGDKFHTFPKCAECHFKQFDFWRTTRHALALNALIDKQQFKNKECLGCHSVGLGDPQGFSDVNRLAETKRQPGSIPLDSPSPGPDAAPALPIDDPIIEALGPTELATYLNAMHGAKSLQDKVRLTPAFPELPLHRSVSSLNRAWTPVQCENCHEPGREHPFSGTYSKKVENSSCLKCHTAERAPEWYTSGKLDLVKFQAKRAQVACPAGSLSELESE
jgi:hypothetical protein